MFPSDSDGGGYFCIQPVWAPYRPLEELHISFSQGFMLAATWIPLHPPYTLVIDLLRLRLGHDLQKEQGSYALGFSLIYMICQS